MIRLIATCAVLAAIAVPAVAQPFASDNLVEARSSIGGAKSAKSALKCRFVNGQLVCTF